MLELVPAKSILVRNKDPRWFGIDYQMNLYRGCCHGCLYCDSRSDCYHIPDFDRKDAIISGVESRTSSPVRIRRDEVFEANIRGIYPCGEGAGYAGGITSAAMDGMKVAEAVIRKYQPFK